MPPPSCEAREFTTDRATDPNKRVFDVKIELPSQVIFEGRESFANIYELKATMHIESKLTVDTEVIRAPQSFGM
jgi:hypothetical protein